MSKVIFFNRSLARASETAAQQMQPVGRMLTNKTTGRVARRNPLFAVWHTNPFTGKLECLWAADTSGRDQDEASLRAG
jgi:hypothetical protein